MPFLDINKKTAALLSMLLIVTVWGSASSVTKLSVENIPPYIFAFLRNGIASLCLIPLYIHYRKQNPPPQPRPPLGKLIWMGLTGVTFFYIFFNLGLYYTTAAAGALIQGFIPVAIIVLAIFFLKEKLVLMQGAGILISVVGVVLIGFVGSMPEARDNLLGNTLIIFAVLSWGAYTIISKTMQQYDPVYLTCMTTWIGTLGLVPAVVVEYWNNPVLPDIASGGWISLIYLGLFSSTICYILYNRVMKVLSAIQIGNLMNLDPVIGAVIAVIFLHERVTVWQVTGAILVLLGVALASAKLRGKNPEH